jgi:hypothetical protein
MVTTPPGTQPPAALPPSRPRAPLRRLSRVQYNNTIRDLLGDSSRPADAFVKEETPGAFSGSALTAQPAPVIVDQYRTAAESLAASAVKNLATLVPCQPQPNEEACARAFIDDFGLRAFRRPVTTTEAPALLDVFRKVRVESDFTFAIQSVVATMLQAPSFLYRVELPPAGAAPGTMAALGPYQVASRLSYFLWNTMPDRALFDAAKAGKLTTPAEIEAQARRMLDDPRARDAGSEFFTQWLGLARLDTRDKSAKLFPEWTDTLRTAMQEETRRFSLWAMFDGDGKPETLLTAPKSMINSTLGKIYGVTATSSSYALVNLDPTQRSGLLTHASLLALASGSDSTSPTLRGKFVLDQLICQSPPPPPPDVDFTLPALKPGQTARERFAAHTTNPTCAACHKFIDPVGFGFENYDAIGKWRTTDAGQPVDASGSVNNTRDMDGPFVGAIALGKKLVASAQARECMVKKWFSFGQGRTDDDGDQASIASALGAFGTNATVRDMLVALTRTDSFRTRLVEVAQ